MKDKIIDFLNKLPFDSSPEFTTQITSFITNSQSSIERDLFSILEDKSNAIQIRFSAFYTLMVLFRRNKKFSKMEEVCISYKEIFIEKPLFLFQMSMVFRKYGDANNLQIALEYSKESLHKIIEDDSYDSSYPGFYNNFSEIVAMMSDENILIDGKTLDLAFKYINKAIIMNSNYPKYYCTLGRLQVIKGDYKNARQNILKAIDLEDTKEDYAIRISEYQSYLIKCQTAKLMEETYNNINGKLEEISNIKENIKDDIQDGKNNILEFIGFFSAIITFIISSVQISTKLIFSEAVSLLLVMLGALLIAFGSFKTIIEKDNSNMLSTLLMGIIGGSVIVIAIVLKYFLA